MRILFTSGREPEYPRNAMIRAALTRHFDVISVTNSSRNFFLRYLQVGWHLVKSAKADFDLMFVGFLGQPLMLLVHLLTPKPILFDAFLSVYDTLCFERRKFAPHSTVGKIAFWLDRASCARADRVLLDTKAQADFFQHTFGVPANKLQPLFVGCDENIFYPRPSRITTPLVLYYGSYLPLQGIDVIVRAAKLLEERSNINFRIIGTGSEAPHIRALAREMDIRNITFLPPVPLEQLPEHIQEATVCLGGHFGSSTKSSRVIAGKTFQFIAMGKPTIVGDNAANHELLSQGYDAWFCRMNNPEALADAILRLNSDPELCTKIGGNAHKTFLEHASIQVLSSQLIQIVELMIG